MKKTVVAIVLAACALPLVVHAFPIAAPGTECYRVIVNQPGEVVADRGFKLWAAAGEVDVLDAQQEPPAEVAGGVVRQHRRQGVAEMQPAGRTRGEAQGDGIS